MGAEHPSRPLSYFTLCLRPHTYIGDNSKARRELGYLPLLLGYQVQSHGTSIAYGTYTAWWEVEGHDIPEECDFVCRDITSLRQRLLAMSIKQFDLVIELAYQVLSEEAKFNGEAALPTGQPLLCALAR